MMKIAFKMKLMPGCKEEYRKRHEAIWPEMVALLKENGISDYTIFVDDETNTLFAVQLQADGAQSSQELGNSPVMQRWWAYMADIMETHADNSPVSKPLVPVFHLD
ncbi:L-rhamnose mutarotase [Parapedobacter deserti]|uniref:L-rhamnose mutarotase n=1 Tax=Parapedobacter deserti TaxID=1912957 RepID=A0ABV7JQ06_9SPHI